MVADSWTVAWKELKLLLEGSSRGKLWPLIFLAVFGVLMPAQLGLTWISTPVAVAFWTLIPVIFVSAWVADSFAGERERHTLETLLASRLSDRAILVGKVGAGAGCAWLLALAAMLLGLATVNVVNWPTGPHFYPTAIWLAGVGLSLLTSTLTTNAGVLVSLRSPTVRQAQQTVGIAVMVVTWVPILGLNFIPVEWKQAVASGLVSATVTQIALAVAAGLLVLDVALFAAVVARFQRARLILD